MKYQYFKDIIEKYNEVDEKLYNDLVEEYGREKVEDSFERYLTDKKVKDDDNKFLRVKYYLENVNRKDSALDSLELSFANNNFDTVKVYLKEIGAIPLLTEEEELYLAKKIKSLKNELNNNNFDIDKANLLLSSFGIDNKLSISKKIIVLNKLLQSISGETAKEINQLINDLTIYQELRDLEDKFIAANLRLVVSIAKRYINSGIELLDLIQEGNFGLKKALNRFDVNKGYKFSTYATWWIRQSITRFIADYSRTIRVPIHMNELINKIAKIERVLESELQRNVTDKELLDYIYKNTKSLLLVEGITNPTIDQLKSKSGMDLAKIREIRKAEQPIVSLNTPIGEDEDNTLMDFIPDNESNSVENIIIQNSHKDYVENLMTNIKNIRDRLVIILRYGLKMDDYLEFEDFVSAIYISNTDYNYEELMRLYEYFCNTPDNLTLEKIGKIMGVTRERVRQIEIKAVRRIRFLTRNDRNIL